MPHSATAVRESGPNLLPDVSESSQARTPLPLAVFARLELVNACCHRGRFASAARPPYRRVMALLAQGWLDWSRYGAVMVGATVGLVRVVLTGVLPLWRARPRCQFGPPTVEVFMGKHLTFGSRPLPTSLVPRLRITIPI